MNGLRVLGITCSLLAVACGGSDSGGEVAPPTAAVVEGIVLSDLEEPIAGAHVELAVGGARLAQDTGADGRFRIALTNEEWLALPEYFFVTAEAEDYTGEALELLKGSEVSYEGTTHTASAEVPGADVVHKVKLQKSSVPGRSAYRFQTAVLRLGNSQFQGAANGKFQIPVAESESKTFSFTLPGYDASSVHRAWFWAEARGVECQALITVNGTQLYLPTSAENGGASHVGVEIDPTTLVATENQLRIEPTPCFEDLDDLELAGMKLTLYTSATVAEVASLACDTTPVMLLSDQIVEQLNCNYQGGLTNIASYPQVVLRDNAYPYLETSAAWDLGYALEELPNEKLVLTSALRTTPQQYLLHYSAQHQGACPKKTALPSTSRHERGLGIDLQNWQLWRPALEKHGFVWLGKTIADEYMHFEYTGASDVLTRSITAFQTLWNANNPSDPIPNTELGTYGPATSARLPNAPAAGFLIGPSCR